LTDADVSTLAPMSGSHKTRDKRCHIAAPLLQDVITSTLALHDYTVDHKGSSLHDLPAAEQLEKLDAAGGDDAVENLLRKVAGGGGGGTKKEGSKEVGVFHISHLGGHRYSGVMIVRSSVIVSGKGTKRDWTDVWHLCPPLGSVPPLGADLLPVRLDPLLRPGDAQGVRRHRRADDPQGQGPARAPPRWRQPDEADRPDAARLVDGPPRSYLMGVSAQREAHASRSQKPSSNPNLTPQAGAVKRRVPCF
jgi:hypothetical protein